MPLYQQWGSRRHRSLIKTEAFMELYNDPEFWEWVKERRNKEKHSDFEQIPLHITLEIPIKENSEQSNILDDKEKDSKIEYDIDHTIDDSIVFQF